MKRAVKLWNKYENDNYKFSNCSTDYEVLPFLIPSDIDGDSALASIAAFLSLKVAKKFETIEPLKWPSSRVIKTTNAVKIPGETKTVHNGLYFKGDEKQVPVYLALLEIGERSGLSLVEDLSGKIDSEILHKMIDSSAFDIRDIIELDGETNLLIESWDAFHLTELYGYQNFKTLLKDLEIEESVFDDSVFQCGECQEWDFNDSGYTYNYRIIGCKMVGVNCGCHVEAMKNNLEGYINNPDKAVESEVLEVLDAEKLETFIGGMVDGRGGYINGESVRESSPEKALKEYSEKYPNAELFFVHEESGQFQTYFSIYKLNQEAA